METKTSLVKLLFQALWIAAGFTLTTNAASFPPPTGPFNTTLSTAQLKDNHRKDPFASVPTARSLMISVFHPVDSSTCSSTSTGYIEPITAEFEDNVFSQYGIPAGTFESLELYICNQSSLQRPASPRQAQKKYPLILFSPGLGRTRLFYSAMAQEISSFGYIVVTIDHPYDGDIVVFPDNSTILGADIETEAQINQALDTRRKDISFVLDQLALPSIARKVLPNYPTQGIDLCKGVGVYGHSLGGAAAAEVMLFDSRLVGGINLDGSFYGKVVQQGLDKPFLVFAHEGKNVSTDASWDAIWGKLTGWKRMLELKGSAHGTFMDLPSVLDVLGIGGSLPSEVEELLGNIEGERGFEIVTLYVRTFFDMVLKGKKSGLLNQPSPLYPEISFESS